MPKISTRTNLAGLTDPKDFQKHGSAAISDIAETVNGSLEFDKNIKSQHVTVKFTQANVDTAVPHTLSKVGLHYLIAKKSADCSVYDGTRPASSNVVYLRCSQVATVVVILY